jgi:hypothetical protein
MTAKAPAITDREKKNDAGSKQARVIAMLQSPTGMTARLTQASLIPVSFPCRPSLSLIEVLSAARSWREQHDPPQRNPP